MKEKFLFLFFLIVAANAQSQTLSPTVISTAGNYYSGAGITWSWTMGETIIPTISAGANMLSQGFQQPEVEIVTGAVSSPICSGATIDIPYTAYGIIGSNNVFTVQLSDASGSFSSPVNIGSATGNASGTISVTIPLNTVTGTGYRIRVVSNLPNYNGKNNGVDITINTQVTTSVTVSASQTSVCEGTPVSFTANAVNGGGIPAYQWKVNGINAGINSSAFSSSLLNNNDVITCELTSNAVCVTGSPASSNSVSITVTPNVPASVTISSSSASICPGNAVNFTATPANNGTIPVYQWKVNGLNAGTNSTVFSSTSLNNNDVITFVMTSNAICVTGSPATSNSITITVTPNVPASVSISSATTTICNGTQLDFTASPVNGGTPSFQWKVNGVNSGTNNNIFSTSSLNNGDAITCVMTSGLSCATGSPATSNSVSVTVTPNAPVSVNISASTLSTCPGTKVNFTAAPVNGGTPSYQWKINGADAGASASTFSSSSLQNNDAITCVITSTATCATGSPATSNIISISVGVKSVAGIISAIRDTICDGTPGTLNVAGNSGTVQWQSSSTPGNFADISGANGNTYLAFVSQTTYYREIVGAGGCPDTSNVVELVVKPSPVAAFTHTGSGELHFNSDASVGATIFHWEFGDGGTSDIANPVHKFPKDTLYHICLTVYNGSNCSFTVCQDVQVSADGIADIDTDNSLLIFPNPFSDNIFISSNDNIHTCTLEVYDVLGRQVMNFENVALQKNPVQLNLSELSQGMYLLKIKTDKADFIHRMIKM